MAQLIIKNIGPIKDINITLNKVNVIIGPQSSGKSTINKIACFCSWVEKKVSLEQSFDFFIKDDIFINSLIIFHKLDGYLRNNSYIYYKSEILKIEYTHPQKMPNLQWVNKSKYKRVKLSYIPAERNIISIISDWKEVSLPDNNIRNFMSDWNTSRKLHKINNSTYISSLDIEYFFDEDKETDYIVNKDGSKISLMSASSGIQSYVPLYILTDYFTKWIYENEEPQSVASQEKDLRIFSKIRNDISSEFNIEENSISNLLGKKPNELNQNEIQIRSLFIDKFRCFISNNGTKLYIEEPELNLFPSVQKSVLYYLIRSIQERKEDTVIITTHSPYILYSLNNCIMGWLVKDNMPEDVANSLESHNSWIDPKLVSAWQIKDGEIFSIQEHHTNSIGKHYFNEIMNETMDEYYTMLNYFVSEKK